MGNKTPIIPLRIPEFSKPEQYCIPRGWAALALRTALLPLLSSARPVDSEYPDGAVVMSIRLLKRWLLSSSSKSEPLPAVMVSLRAHDIEQRSIRHSLAKFTFTGRMRKERKDWWVSTKPSAGERAMRIMLFVLGVYLLCPPCGVTLVILREDGRATGSPPEVYCIFAGVVDMLEVG